ncbi:hypothetical protein FHL15_006063 [Xylaria flabelliformis]|uniref:Signal recognition particle subunit SRP72 n=1 Tax=Xylaria flabelliformis TaxID=2512241 RepID=A0A553HY95_9PEZI|nr:hypothetical protein FHL15_006063 [Xylaria flabelliformis]
MSSPAAALTSLLRASTIQDHDEVLKLANAAIKASKSDIDASHTRVVALLKLDRFDDALRAIAEGGDALEARCVLEKAYALYKTGHLQEARDAAEKAPSAEAASRPFRHLRAQIAYRAESFPDAASIYRDLASDQASQHGDESDIRINLLATNAQLEWAGIGNRADDGERQSSRADLESFETAYNAACLHIARAELAKASILLKRARDLCEASEDLSPEEKKAELLPIMVQHVYVLAQLGKDSEATALQKLITQSEYVTIVNPPINSLSYSLLSIPEAPTRAVSQNNQIALAGTDGNPYLTQRVAEMAGNLSGNDKLFEFQQSVLKRNKYALDLQMQKFHGADASTHDQILSASTPTAVLDVAPLGVINAAARSQMEKGKAAIRKILPVLEKRPNDVGLLLTIIQLYVQMREPGPALTVLETFLKRLETATTADYADVRFSPGLVAAAVALYRLQGRQNSIRVELARASAHWRSKPECPSTSLLREAGVELLRSSNPEDVAAAGATFEKLVAQPSQDTISAAGLVASFATRDFAKVEPYLQKLTPVEKLTGGINVQALVNAGVCSIAPPVPTTKKRSATGGPEKEKPAKRRRKKRLPKDYEEGKQPDPERWLPLRDRSTYRPKGKKGKKRAQEATQGGVVKEEETLELVGGAGAVKVEKATGGKKKKKGKK